MPPMGGRRPKRGFGTFFAFALAGALAHVALGHLPLRSVVAERGTRGLVQLNSELVLEPSSRTYVVQALEGGEPQASPGVAAR